MGANGNGFVAVRRGILDHCERGDLTPLQFAAYMHLILLADAATGVAWSSAKSLAERFGYNDRYARQILEVLEDKGYIKRFSVPGRHGQYAILVNKYCASRGARKGLLLNAAKSIDWRQPVFESCEENGEGGVEDTRHENCEDNSPLIGRQQRNEQGDISVPSPAAPQNGKAHDRTGASSTPDDLAAVNRVWRYYIEKFGKNPKLLTLSSTRMQKGLARLAEARRKTAGDLAKAEQLMCIAVDALAASAWHGGENPNGKKYQSWEKHLFKNADQFEERLEQAQ